MEQFKFGPEKMVFNSSEDWKRKLKEAGVALESFDSIIDYETPPPANSGYEKTEYEDIILDGKKVNVYLKKDPEGKWRTVYLYVKG